MLKIGDGLKLEPQLADPPLAQGHLWPTLGHLWYRDQTTTYDLLAGGGSGSVKILDEGTTLTTAVSSIDFVGSGVTATAVGNAVTVNIAGGGGSPASPDTAIQYNNAGAFGATAEYKIDTSNKYLRLGATGTSGWSIKPQDQSTSSMVGIPLTIEAGNQTTGSQQGGTLYLKGGYCASGPNRGGEVQVLTQSKDCTTGDIWIKTGDATSAYQSGGVFVRTGSVMGLGGAVSGEIQLYTGDSTGIASSGAIRIKSGGSTNNGSGQVYILTSPCAGGGSGNITIMTGSSATASNGSGGHITIEAGTGSSSNGEIRLNLSNALKINSSAGGSGHVLTSQGAGSPPIWSAPAGATPPSGSNTQVQFNDSGAFGGDADFTWDKTNNVLTVAGSVRSNSLRVSTSSTPSSASATGTTGDICWDSDYIYVCIATNTWKRAAISTW